MGERIKSDQTLYYVKLKFKIMFRIYKITGKILKKKEKLFIIILSIYLEQENMNNPF